MKKIQIINIYQIAAIVIFIVGLFFTYLIAELNDAPGFILLGTSATAFFCLILFGYGSLIDIIKSNNEILTNIYQELKKRKQ